MMSVATYPLSAELVLPWSVNETQERKFKETLEKILIPLLLLFLIIPWLPVFEPEFIESEEKVIKTKVILKAPIVEKSRQVKKVTVKPAKSKKKAASKIANKSNAKTPVQGMAALSKQLSALRASVDTSKFQNKNVVVSNSGKVQKSQRQHLGQENATRRSGGIQLSDTPVNSVTMAAHQSTAVDSPIQVIGNPGGSQRGYDSSLEGRRDMESIRRVFEQYKGSVFALYTSSLRSHPELQGKFLFELIIEPDGTISALKLINSDLGYAALERNILVKIKGIQFGQEDVSATSVQYKFVFLPS